MNDQNKQLFKTQATKVKQGNKRKLKKKLTKGGKKPRKLNQSELL